MCEEQTYKNWLISTSFFIVLIVSLFKDRSITLWMCDRTCVFIANAISNAISNAFSFSATSWLCRWPIATDERTNDRQKKLDSSSKLKFDNLFKNSLFLILFLYKILFSILKIWKKIVASSYPPCALNNLFGFPFVFVPHCACFLSIFWWLFLSATIYVRIDKNINTILSSSEIRTNY
jgi:hypothetical protein